MGYGTQEFRYLLRNQRPLAALRVHRCMQPVVRNNTDLRRREMLLLPGLLVKWYSLYGQAPDPSSWVWSFFPDGPFWLQGVKRYRQNAVRVLTDIYRTSVNGSSILTAFSSRRESITSDPQRTHFENQRGRRRDRILTLSNITLPVDAAKLPGHAVFYHIGVPNEADRTLRQQDEASQILAVKDMIDVQLEIVSRPQATSRQINLFYTVAGQGSLVEQDDLNSMETCASKQNLACRPLQALDRNYEGETLLEVYRFCQRFRRIVFHTFTIKHQCSCVPWEETTI
jgi:hypothetical protein